MQIRSKLLQFSSYLVLQIMDLFITIDTNYICQHRLDYAMINKPWNLNGLIKQKVSFSLMQNVMTVGVSLKTTLLCTVTQQGRPLLF